jgi:D-serine deaminase-like pyridoxal phosphate-dependent protein
MRDEPKLGVSCIELDTPALLLDLDRFQRNIKTMADFFSDKATVLRPHAKTHKCPRIAIEQLKAGAIGITCAKVSEAETMAQAGVHDILIANQVVGAIKIKRLVNLARGCDMIVAVDNAENVRQLSQACQANHASLRVLVELDIGMHRCGVQPGLAALDLARQVAASPGLQFAGLMGYEGHLVMVRDPVARERGVKAAMAAMQETFDLLESNGLPVPIVSGGGTGTYNITGACSPMTEIQAGSYVFMDSTYAQIRPEFESALTVLATIISRPVRDRLVTDTGRKAITQDFGLPSSLDVCGASVRALSEEHGTIELADPEAVSLQPGDKIRFMPSHCCTTVNLHDRLYVIQNDVLVDIWPIAARGCAQ